MDDIIYYECEIPEWVSDDNISLYIDLYYGRITEDEFWEKYEC